MKSNTAQLAIAKKYLGDGCRKCCSMANNCCCYFVCKVFKEADNSSLFYGGKTVTYCPTAITWARANLAQIPPYLAMPSDVIFFDWELNGTPNHIGFVANRVSDQEVHTLEGNTTSNYVVAYQTRTAKYIQGIFRPHFKPTSFDTSKPLTIDGKFDYSSIAMLQKALGIKVDGILGKSTIKALQKKAGVAQDGSWGIKTSRAVQKMVGTTVDGAFGQKSVKALQTWINKQVKMPTPAPTPTPKPTPAPKPTTEKLTVDGAFGKKSIRAAQKYFGTTVDGEISGQLKKQANKMVGIDTDCIGWGGGGSALITAIQKKLGATANGIINADTNKAIQKWLGVKQDGIWGKETSKAFQKFLNDPGKNPPKKVVVQTVATKPVVKQTFAEKGTEWARKIAKSGKYKYKKWSSNTNTHKCPICHPNTGNGWNCIGWLFAIWHHGCGLKCNCNCGVIANEQWEKLLTLPQNEADALATKCTGVKTKVIRNGGKAIPLSKLKAGDGIAFFKGKEYYHTAYYEGDGKYSDSTSGRTPNIKADVTLSNYAKGNIKVAIRYVG